MPNLLIKELPRYECLLEASQRFPSLDPSACEVFLHLLRAGDEAFLHMEQNLTHHGISHGRFGVLMQLWGAGNGCTDLSELTPAALADRTGVTRATMTGLIDTLERDGFVKRTVDTHDRRMQRVGLTANARDFMVKMLPGHFQRMAALMAPLNGDERTTLVTLLTKILQHISSLQAAAEPPSAAAL
ncbi:MAG: MarR family winged helix-turn-helix transcriptional regulator [Opitutales bacterium]